MEQEPTGSSSPELRNRSLGSNSPNWSAQRRGSIPRSLDDMSDIGPSDPVVNENNVIYTTEMAPRSLNIAPRAHRLTYPASLIKATTSSPNLLNEICEENESDFDDSPRNSPRAFRRQQRRQRKYDKKRPGCRLSPIHSRRSSCSSSDDEEFQKLDRRLNIQTAISAARILPNVPENSGDRENTGEKNGCHESGKAKSFDLFERFFETEKETTTNCLNAFDGPNKLFVTSVSGRVRNLSDTNLVSYQARYRLPIFKHVKCSSDTNLAISVNGKKALIQRPDVIKLSLKQHPFGLCNSPTLSSASPIEEENPSDLSPDASPSTEPKHGFNRGTIKSDAPSSCTNSRVEGNIDRLDANSDVLMSHLSSNTASLLPSSNSNLQHITASEIEAHFSCPVIALEKNASQRVNDIADTEEFSSIQEPEDCSSALLTSPNGVRDSGAVQSRSGSRSSLKYIYNDMANTDANSCYTIVETRSAENVKNPVAIPGRTQQSDVPRYSVGKFGQLIANTPVNSKCCTIL